MPHLAQRHRAVQAGATVIMPMTDMFFGSREGRIADPFGNVWTIGGRNRLIADARRV
jgi:PhnB protein